MEWAFIKQSGSLTDMTECKLYVSSTVTFSNPTFCPHSVFLCCVWISEQTAIISLYNINWLVFVTETECVYCAVRTKCLRINNPLKPSGHYMYRPVVTICTTSLTFTDSTFCPHSVFLCFVWISEQTAIISLYNINWLVFVTETECVYCAVRTKFLCINNPLKPNGHYIYHQFNIQQFHLLPTHCIYVFCVDLRTNSHYFPTQH